MEKTENLILYDWLSFSSKIHSPEYIIENLLGMYVSDFERIKGARGYKQRYYYDGISVHYDGAENQGVWCEMSGQGCRTFETNGTGDFERIFDLLLKEKENMNFTRLDIAYDDHSGILPINQICQDTRELNFISKSTYWEVINSSKGDSVFIGSPQSDTRIRIYDKARERNKDNEHWIRVEMQLRDYNCYGFVKHKLEIGQRFCGVLLRYLRYLEPEAGDCNKSRWSLRDYWAELLQNAAAISIFTKPGVEYNLASYERYVLGQAGPSIQVLIDLLGEDGFLKLFKNANIKGDKVRHDSIRRKYSGMNQEELLVQLQQERKDFQNDNS